MNSFKTERVPTDELKPGDRVINYGMILLVTESPQQSNYRQEPVFYVKTSVENIDEVRKARIVPLAWLYPWKSTRKGHELDFEATPTYKIQGSHSAYWFRIIPE